MRLSFALLAPAAQNPKRLFISSAFQDHLPCTMEAADLPCIDPGKICVLITLSQPY